MAFDFIQFADPQFGMFDDLSKLPLHRWNGFLNRLRDAGALQTGAPDPVRDPVDGIEPEIDRMQWAVGRANDHRPAFVVICGDLVNNVDQPAQLDALRQTTAQIQTDILLHLIPGNHDLSLDGSAPTPDALSAYRDSFHDDFFSFTVEDTHFLALNSETLHRPEHLPDEAPRQFEFIADSLSSRPAREAGRIIAFTHTPLFLRDPEQRQPGAISGDYRRKLVELFTASGVEAVFSGHLHHNRTADADGLRQIVSGPVGFPLAGRSGYTTVHVPDDPATPIQYAYHEYPHDPNPTTTGPGSNQGDT